MNAFTGAASGSLGHQPHIDGGIRAEALVLESSASIPLNNMARVTLGGWSRWVGGVPLEVRVPGLPPSYPCPMRWLTRSKYPIAGTVLPITVDRVDASILRIEWDQVAEIDEWIAGGHPVFTDPDSAEARVHQALQARSAAAAVDAQRSQIDIAAQAMGPGLTMDRDLLSRSFDNAQQATPDQQPELPRQPVNGPSARILAVGYEGEGDGARAIRGEVLLSVAAPGSYRYGARWRGWIPQAKLKRLWWDVPVSIDAGNPRDVQIRWDEVAGIEAVTSVLHSMNDRLEAQLAAGPAQGVRAYQGLLSAITDPVHRAQVEQQLAQGLSAVRGAAAPPVPTPAAPRLDPLDELKRLGELRASGALSEADFAAEKARVLATM